MAYFGYHTQYLDEDTQEYPELSHHGRHQCQNSNPKPPGYETGFTKSVAVLTPCVITWESAEMKDLGRIIFVICYEMKVEGPVCDLKNR